MDTDATGDNPGEASAYEQAFNAGSAEPGTATETEAQQSDEGTPQGNETDGVPEDTQDNPDDLESRSEQETTETDWKVEYEKQKQSYTELQKLVGRQGNELGELRRRLETHEQKLPKENPKEDPFEQDEVLRSLNPQQRKVFNRAVQVGIQQTFQEMGIDPKSIPQMQQAIVQQQQVNRARELKAEADALKSRIGDESWSKYRPKIHEWYEQHDWPERPLAEVYKLVSYDELAMGQAKRAEQVRKSRSERAKAADTGKPSPKSAQTLGPDSEALEKMSRKQAWAAIHQAEGGRD